MNNLKNGIILTCYIYKYADFKIKMILRTHHFYLIKLVIILTVTAKFQELKFKTS